MSRITFIDSSFNVAGVPAVYALDVMIDGKIAFSLRRHDFREPGQMSEFIELLRAYGSQPSGTAPLPCSMNREKCIGILRGLVEMTKPALSINPKKEPTKSRRPVELLVDYIDACGFPEK